MSTLENKPEPLPAALGEVIGGYRLDQVLGTGGMGCVYSATHARLSRRAAVKVLRGSLAHDPSFIARFFDEARVVNEIRHPNIIDIFDFVETTQPRRVACVMELIDGPTLRQVIASMGLDALQATNVAIQLCDALAAVHALGVVHRDLKPANILVAGALSSDLSAVPSVKVLDFGIAKIKHLSDEHKTAAGLVLGTPAYMAPEQIAGEEVAPSSDIYALGVVYYEMLAGERLFPGHSSAVMKQKFIGDLGPIELPPSIAVGEDVRRLVRATVVPDPTKRMALPAVRAALVEIRSVIAMGLGPTAMRGRATSLPGAVVSSGAARRSVELPSFPYSIDDLPSARPRTGRVDVLRARPAAVRPLVERGDTPQPIPTVLVPVPTGPTAVPPTAPVLRRIDDVGAPTARIDELGGPTARIDHIGAPTARIEVVSPAQRVEVIAPPVPVPPSSSSAAVQSSSSRADLAATAPRGEPAVAPVRGDLVASATLPRGDLAATVPRGDLVAGATPELRPAVVGPRGDMMSTARGDLVETPGGETARILFPAPGPDVTIGGATATFATPLPAPVRVDVPARPWALISVAAVVVLGVTALGVILAERREDMPVVVPARTAPMIADDGAAAMAAVPGGAAVPSAVIEPSAAAVVEPGAAAAIEPSAAAVVEPGAAAAIEPSAAAVEPGGAAAIAASPSAEPAPPSPAAALPATADPTAAEPAAAPVPRDPAPTADAPPAVDAPRPTIAPRDRSTPTGRPRRETRARPRDGRPPATPAPSAAPETKPIQPNDMSPW